MFEKLAQDIFDFHEKFNLKYDGLPRPLDPELMAFRSNFIVEENNELVQSNQYLFDLSRSSSATEAEIVEQLEQVLDAYVDLIYVVMGTAHMQGMTPVMSEAWRRVHRANMAKVRAKSAAASKRNSHFDVVKPKGWQPPRHVDLIVRNSVTGV